MHRYVFRIARLMEIKTVEDVVVVAAREQDARGLVAAGEYEVLLDEEKIDADTLDREISLLSVEPVV